MRFDRNSDSMVVHFSRNFPTAQDNSVGMFRLELDRQTSDKSAMPSLEQVKKTILTAMAAAGEGPVTAAERMGLERTYLSDFFLGKKRSLSAEVRMALVERYKLDFKDLMISKPKRSKRAA